MANKLNKRVMIFGRIIGYLFFFGILAIPTGLIMWLFNPDGWKIAVAGVISLPFTSFIVAALNKYSKQSEEED